MHRQRLTVSILCVLGAVATYLPWVKVPFIGQITGIRGWGDTFTWDGRVAFILFTLSVVVCFLGPLKQPMNGWRFHLAYIPSALAAAVGSMHLIRFSYFVGMDPEDPYIAILQAGSDVQYGLYLMITSGLLAVLAAWWLGRSPITDSRTSPLQ